MEPISPFWFKQRQAKATPAGDNTYRLTAPNMDEAYISIRQGDNGLWSALLRRTPDGPILDETEPRYKTPQEAWDAAFELYRVSLVV